MLACGQAGHRALTDLRWNCSACHDTFESFLRRLRWEPINAPAGYQATDIRDRLDLRRVKANYDCASVNISPWIPAWAHYSCQTKGITRWFLDQTIPYKLAGSSLDFFGFFGEFGRKLPTRVNPQAAGEFVPGDAREDDVRSIRSFLISTTTGKRTDDSNIGNGLSRRTFCRESCDGMTPASCFTVTCHFTLDCMRGPWWPWGSGPSMGCGETCGGARIMGTTD